MLVRWISWKIRWGHFFFCKVYLFAVLITVEVILCHFHRCRYLSSTDVVLLLEGHRSFGELAIREYGGH
jgi:hypothetical protein